MQSKEESYCDKPPMPDNHIEVIVPDANIWIKYFGDEIDDDMDINYKKLREYVDDRIMSKRFQVTKKIMDESKNAFERRLSALDRYGRLNNGKAYYTGKLNKLFKKIHVEKNVGERNMDFKLVGKLYDRIWNNPSDEYKKKRMRWGKIKYEGQGKKNKSMAKWDDLEYKKKLAFILDNQPPTSEDQIILSTVAFMKKKDGNDRNFALLSADSDFWMFADDICNEFKVKVLNLRKFITH